MKKLLNEICNLLDLVKNAHNNRLLHLSYKTYDYPNRKVYYVTLNGNQILGVHFTEQEVLATIDSLRNGSNKDNNMS